MKLNFKERRWSFAHIHYLSAHGLLKVGCKIRYPDTFDNLESFSSNIQAAIKKNRKMDYILDDYAVIRVTPKYRISKIIPLPEAIRIEKLSQL
jgi:hypothetical protein